MATRETGVDQATGAFRRLLADAGSSEQARVDALVAFSQRLVLAPTWPGQQAVRTLTNHEGETAMPLFTGQDVLDETASRFGWRNADGSLPMRRLEAREALMQALARGVQFVVVDIGSPHAMEFGRLEIEPMLALPADRTGPFAAAGEPQAQLRDAVRRSNLPPSMGSAVAKRAAPTNLPQIDAPFADLKPGKTPGERPVSQPLPARPASRPISRPLRDGPLNELDAPSPRADSQPLPRAQPGSQPKLPPTRPISQTRLPAARPASQPLMPAVRPGSEPRLPAARPASAATIARGDATTPSAAREVAARARTAASLAEARPPSINPPPMPAAARAAQSDATAATQPEPASPDASGAGREGGEPARELQPGELPDTFLQAVSASLRSFPEVEWACVMADGGELPVIGVRVDPSFLNRVVQITDAIMRVADSDATPVQVLLLSTADLVKTARKQGKAFYPWKR